MLDFKNNECTIMYESLKKMHTSLNKIKSENSMHKKLYGLFKKSKDS